MMVPKTGTLVPGGVCMAQNSGITVPYSTVLRSQSTNNDKEEE
jgi:hypothetical protein